MRSKVAKRETGVRFRAGENRVVFGFGRMSVCPSGRRGYVQVVMFSNAWVQIPQLTFSIPHWIVYPRLGIDCHNCRPVVWPLCRLQLQCFPLFLLLFERLQRYVL